MDSALKFLIFLGAGVLSMVLKVDAQDDAYLSNNNLLLTDRVFKQIDNKTEWLNSRLDRQTKRYLQMLQKQERKLKRLVARKDSSAARAIFENNVIQYAKFTQEIGHATAKTSIAGGKYIPRLDSIQTLLRLLDQSPGLIRRFPEEGASVRNALGQINGLQDRFQHAENLKSYLANRRLFLQKQLKKYNLGKHLRKYNKQVYYYRAQVEEYRHMLDNPGRLEAKALELMSKTSLFKSFFRSHSQLAALFNLPAGEPGTQPASFAGLQTRSSVHQDLLQRFGSNPNLSQLVQQQVQTAQPDLGGFRNKVNEIGRKNSDAEMPGFLPNNQKTKRFMNRLEFGSNLQTVKGNNFYPSTSDIGMSVGYKLNDKSIAGIGSSYKMGWGRSVRQLKLTHEGIGLRSFVDYRIKGNFWISGGAEMNYWSRFDHFDILKDYGPWQKSALIGVSRKYKINQKLRGNAQLMYDFLWKEQVPRAQPAVFRIGYTLK